MVQSTVDSASNNRIEINLQSVDDFRDSMSTVDSVFGKDAKIVFCEDEGKVFAKKLSWPRWPRFHYCNDRVGARLGDLLGEEGEKLADKMNSTFLCCFRIKNSLKVSEFGSAVDNYNFQRISHEKHDTAGLTDGVGLGETLVTSNGDSSIDVRNRTYSSSVETRDETQETPKPSTTEVDENAPEESNLNRKGSLSESLSESGTVVKKESIVEDDSDLDKPLGLYVPDETPLPKLQLNLDGIGNGLSRREEYSNSVEKLGKSLVGLESTPQQTVSDLADAVEKCERMKEIDSQFFNRRESDGTFLQQLSEIGASHSDSIQEQLSDEGQKSSPLPQIIRCVEGLRAYLPEEHTELEDASQIMTCVNNSAVLAAGFMCNQKLENTVDRLKNDVRTLVDQQKNQAPAESIDELADRLQVDKTYLSTVIDKLNVDWKV
ncbi:hypothetical protein AB1L42_01665 [Thalassoglobus sp. JC818]|uniref:hypothetical protein n=1 Tax=Thalassoglobus sp. JC818 TaxID=3232136 RepID=UPI00345ABACB